MNQTISTLNSPLNASVIIPGSKSITNRALLLAALAEGESHLSGVLFSEDTCALMNALTALGIALQPNDADRTCIIRGGAGVFPNKQATIWCKEAGTVGRFLLAACAATVGTYQFDAATSLRQRPLEILLRTLRQQGASIEPLEATQMPLVMKGINGLAGGDITIDSFETGQFVSALLMAAPLSKSSVTLSAQRLVSSPYVAMTCSMMSEFGVVVHRLHQTRFSIRVPQRYQARDYIIEPDFSTASYFFAAAAITGGQMTIQPVERHKSLQADAKFLAVLEQMGCVVDETKQGLTVKGPTDLRGINVDMRDFSDTFMTLATVAPFASSPTTITNISHARLKESDRIAVMRQELEKCQVKVTEGPDWIRIYPSIPQGATIDSHQDHRIAMAFSVLGLRVPGITITHADCVNKTCPTFFDLWQTLNFKD